MMMRQLLGDAAILLGFLALLAYMQAQDAADRDTALDYKVEALEKIVTKCTNRGDNFIVIDGEYYVCGASPTGIKAKEV